MLLFVLKWRLSVALSPYPLQALTELGLVKNIRHISAISGGAWALSVWMFYQPGSTPEAANNDEELLGKARARVSGRCPISRLPMPLPLPLQLPRNRIMVPTLPTCRTNSS